MKSLKSKIISLVLAAAVTLSFTACHASTGGIDMEKYVELELASTFHDVHDQELIDMYGDNTGLADLEEYHDATVQYEVEFFLYQYCNSSPDYLTQETYDRAINIFTQIFQKASFEVLDSNEIDGSQHITVKIHQPDTFYKGITDDEATAIVNEVYPTADTEMTPEREDVFVNLILDELEDYLPQTTSPTTKTVTVIVGLDSTDMYVLDIDTLDALQAEIIPWSVD